MFQAMPEKMEIQTYCRLNLNLVSIDKGDAGVYESHWYIAFVARQI